MKNIYKKIKSGMSLTEMLIATALVGVIIVGVLSVDFATRQSQQTVSKSAQVTNQAGTVMFDIMKNASMVIGTTENRGIDIVGTDPNQTLCLRQDRAGSPSNPLDDTWVCYERTDTAKTIGKCERSSSGNCSGQQTSTLGSNITNFAPVLSIDSAQGSQRLVLQVAITTRHDPAQAVDPLDNPEHTITSEISPPGHSFYGQLNLAGTGGSLSTSTSTGTGSLSTSTSTGTGSLSTSTSTGTGSLSTSTSTGTGSTGSDGKTDEATTGGGSGSSIIITGTGSSTTSGSTLGTTDGRTDGFPTGGGSTTTSGGTKDGGTTFGGSLTGGGR